MRAKCKEKFRRCLFRREETKDVFLWLFVTTQTLTCLECNNIKISQMNI